MLGEGCLDIATSAKPLVVFDGNSLTQGNDVTSAYPDQVAALLGADYDTVNIGKGGATSVSLEARAAAYTDILKSDRRSKNILVFWEASNDLYFGANAADAYTHLVTYCTNRQAAGWTVAVLTVLPRSGGIVPGTFEVDRQAVNTNIRNNFAGFADALVDVALDGDIGDAGDELNPVYYSDGTHMTNAGYAVVAGLVSTGVAAL